MKLVDIEQLIMQAWITSEDLDLVLWRLMDSSEPPSEDEVANLLIGLKALHDSRMMKVWQCYEELMKKDNGIH